MENFIVSMVRLDTKGALSNAELKNFDSLITKFSPTIDNDKFKEFVYLVGKRGGYFVLLYLMDIGRVKKLINSHNW